jgi:hypothetical protein
MKTLVLPPRYSPDSIILARTAAEQGWAVERLVGWNAPSWLADQELVLYGEPLFAAVVTEPLGLALLGPVPDWLTTLPEHLRLRTVQFTTLEAARMIDRPMFIKPAEDKCFQARVYQSGAELPTDELADGTTPVLMAEPVEWTVEWRCFVLDGKVLTSSPYWRDGRLAQKADGSWPATPDERDQALGFAEQVLGCRESSLPPAVVLDVGQIRGKGWAVVEANPAWGSGLYGCAPASVLRVVERACLCRSRLDEGDRRWFWPNDVAN